MSENTESCPCCSGKTYKNCCEPLHLGEEIAETAEQLMRSRYCAYAKKQIEYLMDTWDAQVRTDLIVSQVKEWADQAIFYKLEILNHSEEKNKGTVEFKAHYKLDGEDHCHHEKSLFRKQKGQWYYREGRQLT